MNYRLARKILGTTCTASYTAIKRAYRAKLKEIHPDRNPDRFATDKLATLVLAYTFLKNYRSPFQAARYSRRFKNGGKKCVALTRLGILFLAFQSLLRAETVTLTWKPNSEIIESDCDDLNSENDLLGYRVYWGTQSGNLSNSLNVGNVTSTQITGLLPGTYYFDLTAYDACGNESGHAGEISKVVEISTPTGVLEVTSSGSGNGQVIATVALQAVPEPGSEFVGWTGDADCVDGVVTLETGKNCDAEFKSIAPDPLNITAISRPAYKVASVTVGVGLHVDTTYQLTEFPQEIVGGQIIQTQNGHKGYAAGWTFSVDRAASIYVLFDSRATQLPTWLASFESAGVAQTTNVPLVILKTALANAGIVSMGNNVGAHTFSMYSVVVK